MKNAIALILVLAGSLAACSSSDDGSDGNQQPGSGDRQPIGKADSYGSCAEDNACGAKSSGNCWCDSQCSTFGDCCSDYEAACGSGSSEGCTSHSECGDGRECIMPQCLPGGPCPDGTCAPEAGRCDVPDDCAENEECAAPACSLEGNCPAGYCVGSAKLTFAADYSESVAGQLTAGGEVEVEYDESRLTDCRGEKNGKPAWTIYGKYRIDGSDPKSFWVAGHNPTGMPGTPHFTPAAAGELELWFENTNLWGCIGYDSDSGANYNYTVHAPGE